MLKKKTLFILMLIVCIIGISAVSAAENTTDDTISTDANDESILEEIDDEDILNATENDEVLGNPDPGNYADLYNAINGNDKMEIHLDRDYFYDHHWYKEKHYIITALGDKLPVYVDREYKDPYKNGIPINRGVAIYGDGHTIDAKNIARIFNVNAAHVTLININFINAANSAIVGENYFVVNSTFTSNHGGGGGAMYMGTAINCTFTKNTANNGGAIYRSTAINCTFTENTATNGGAMYGNTANDGGSLYGSTAINCTFTKNTATNGGAIYDSNAEGCIFTQNKATLGGAAYLGSLVNCNLTRNNAEKGGAMYAGTARNSIFTNNSADEGGAAFGLNAFGCTFENNTAHDGGAASQSNATGCRFAQNSAGSDGGAAYKSNLNNCSFTLNSASNDGGAISESNAQSCTFTQNAAEHGGAIAMGFAEDCTFENNTAHQIRMGPYTYGGYGGAAYKTTAANCTFKSNKAENEGGAIYEGSAKNCRFTANMASAGGALYNSPAEDCNFTQNKADLFGGALYKGTAYNCIFTENNAQYCGALNDADAYDSLFISNKADNLGGAMGRGTAFNCTFKDNTEANHPGSINNGKAVLCVFDEGQFNASTIEVVQASFTVPSNMTAGYNAGYKLIFGLTAMDKEFDGFNTTIDVYENGIHKGTYYALSGDDNGWIINLEPGTYNVTLSNDRNMGVENATVKIIVITATTLKADDIQTTYNANDYVVATLSYGDNKTVGGEEILVELNGYAIYNADANGQIRIPTYGLDVGTYIATIKFEGDEDYLTSTTTANITVNKAPTGITASTVTAIYNINKNLVITLKDGNGNALIGKSITVNLNGAKTLKTDKNGQITIPTKGLVPKTYTAKITFQGDANYLKTSKDVKVTVKKAKPKVIAKKKTFNVKKTKKYTITLKDNKGKAIKKAKLTLKVNGKTYKATTNAKGKATFNLKKLTKKGKYTAAIKYKGNKLYSQITKKVKIIIK